MLQQMRLKLDKKSNRKVGKLTDSEPVLKNLFNGPFFELNTGKRLKLLAPRSLAPNINEKPCLYRWNKLVRLEAIQG